MTVDAPEGPRWELALELLARGEDAVRLGRLILRTDPATSKAGHRLHIELPCPVDPLPAMESHREQLRASGNHDLNDARGLIESVCEGDARFAALVADSDVVYEYVYDYGMGTLLVVTARRSGTFDWK